MATPTKKEDIKTYADLRNFIDQQRYHIRFSIIFCLFFEVPALAVLVKLISASNEANEAILSMWVILGGASLTIMIFVGKFTFDEIQKSRREIAEANRAFYNSKES